MGKADIAATGYDLSFNRYKEVVHAQVQHRAPAVILAELERLEDQIGRWNEGISGVIEVSGLVHLRVGDIAEQVRGVTYGKEDASRTAQVGYLPVLRAGNITDQGLSFDDLIYIPSARIARKQFVQKGDVVIAASSGSLDVVGKAAPATIAFNGGFGAFVKCFVQVQR